MSYPNIQILPHTPFSSALVFAHHHFHELIVLVCVQIPNFHKLSIISLAAAVMSIGYSTIAIGVAAHSGKQPGAEYNLNGFTRADGIFGIFNSLGTIAFAYGGHNVVMEIQVSLQALPRLSHIALLLQQLLFMSQLQRSSSRLPAAVCSATLFACVIRTFCAMCNASVWTRVGMDGWVWVGMQNCRF